MNQLNSLPPGPATFGTTFNYNVWTPDTTVTMVTVPWNSDYRDIVYYDSQASLDAWIDSQSIKITFDQLSYAKLDAPISIAVPFNTASRFNYIRVQNGIQPVKGGKIGTNYYIDSPRTYYYFILDVRFISPNKTELVLQLDVWQSFKDFLTFGRSYIERGHVGIAEANNFDDNGRTYLTVPEGLDTGNEFVIDTTYSSVIADTTIPAVGSEGGPSDNSFDIIVCSTTDLTGDPGTVSAPNLATAKGNIFEGLPNGCQILWFTSVFDFQVWVSSMSQFPWITQGIISITGVPPLRLQSGTYTTESSGGQTVNVLGSTNVNANSHPVVDVVYQLSLNWRNNINLGRYSNLKKFLTYPYMAIEMTTYNGTPLLLKPECLASNDISVLMRMHVVPPSPRVALIPQAYNAKQGASGEDSSEYLDMSTGIFDLPTFSILNNAYIGYMAANAHRIGYGYSSADWTQNKALRGNEVAAGQAQSGLENMSGQYGAGQAQMSQSRDLNNKLAQMQAVTSGIGTAIGVTGQAASGNPAGAAMSLASGALNVGAGYEMTTMRNNQQTAIGMAANTSRYNSSMGYGTYIKDSNKQYSDFAAKGDYANEIAGINARVQDAKLIQPTTSGQIGGDAFNLATSNWRIVAKIKRPQTAAIYMVGEYWLRYGYAINRFATMPATYQVMSKFTYWKLKETYLFGSVPEQYRQAVRGIFEKGVTVWSNAADIGMVDPVNNAPISGSYL